MAEIRAPSNKTATDAAIDPAQWVQRHGDGLYRYACMRLRDREAAEEVVQETFLAALQAQGNFTGGSSERTWLTSILKHKVIDRIRATASRHEREQAADGGEPWTPFTTRGLWRDRVAVWNDDPGRLLHDEEFRAVLADCLANLPDNFAVPFVLREFDGLETAEICKVLGITATNLWARLHRARLRLRTCLEKNWFGK